MTLQTDITCPIDGATLTVTTDFPQPKGANLNPHDPDAPEFSWACADGDLIGCPRCGLSGKVVEFRGADEPEIAWDGEELLAVAAEMYARVGRAADALDSMIQGAEIVLDPLQVPDQTARNMLRYRMEKAMNARAIVRAEYATEHSSGVGAPTEGDES